MLFSSVLFLWVFLPVVAISYFLVAPKYKNYLLLLASLIFYAWGEPEYIFLMLTSILINYLFGLGIDTAKTDGLRKAYLVVCVSLNVGILLLFKYTGFFVQNTNILFGTDFVIPDIILPIGISFYTFQALSYVIDVYYGKTGKQAALGVSVQRKFSDLALYISFFPQLIAGPIINYKDVHEQIQKRDNNLDNVVCGLKRFIYGLAKKVLVSNTLALTADQIFALSENELNMPLSWLGIVCYTLQIYFDFSGYSDMAIGLGRIFGFKFLENFNYPYISASIQEFWRRWHISLSTWFRNYLYIPLGGNRAGTFKTYRNLFIVFLITGLWHGANWTFIVWGLWHGFFMLIERLFLGDILQKNKIKPLNHLYTLLVVVLGWVFFRASTLTQALDYIGTMFSANFTYFERLFLYLNREVVLTLVLGILLCGLLQTCLPKLRTVVYKETLITAEMVVLPVLLILSLLSLISGDYNPFIYFQF